MPLRIELAAALVGLLLLGARPARAQGVALNRRVQLTFTVGPRIAWLTPYSHRYKDVLSAYGYGQLPVYGDLSADAAYSMWSFLDVGGHVGYAFASAGAGEAPAQGALVLHVVELGGFVRGVFVRNRPSSTGGLCLGLEAGTAIPVLALHGEAKGGATYYVGPALGLHIGDTDKVQPVLRLRYLFANWRDALGPGVNLPLGGLTISFGVNVSI